MLSCQPFPSWFPWPSYCTRGQPAGRANFIQWWLRKTSSAESKMACGPYHIGKWQPCLVKSHCIKFPSEETSNNHIVWYLDISRLQITVHQRSQWYQSNENYILFLDMQAELFPYLPSIVMTYWCIANHWPFNQGSMATQLLSVGYIYIWWRNQPFLTLGLFCKHGLTVIRTWLSDYIHGLYNNVFTHNALTSTAF